MKRQFPLHIHISTLFLVLILMIGGLIGGISYNFSRDMVESAAEDLVERIGREMLGEIQRIMAPAEMAVALLSESDVKGATTLEDRLARVDFMRQALDNSAALSSLYMGYGNGDFFFLRRVFDDAERISLKAPVGTRYVVQSIERGSQPDRGRYIYLDDTLQTLRVDDRQEYAAGYDPRRRDWFKDATGAAEQIRTTPYVFFSNHKVGMTLAVRGSDTDAVAGADILLETLGASIARQRVTPGTQVALVNSAGQLIAHEDAARLVRIPEGADAKPRLARLEDLSVPVLPHLGGLLRRIHNGGSPQVRQTIDGENWHVSINPVVFDATQPLYLIIAIPDRELLAAAVKLRSTAILITVLIILLAIPITWGVARGISRPLRRLAHDAEAIRHFDFSQPANVRSMIQEVDELGVTMDEMKRTIRRFLDISAAVAAEDDFDRLLPMLLTETLAAANADIGVLYLAKEPELVPAAALKADGSNLVGTMPTVSMDAAGPLVAGAISRGTPCAAGWGAGDAEPLGLNHATFSAAHGVAVPLVNRKRELIGVILLLRQNAIEESQLSFLRALSGSAVSSVETRGLIDMQKELFEAFIQLTASAIDAKSPYTGGHCARVPELTKMLARAACADTTGPYKDFHLSPDEWEAVHVAAWLHDCGKVTTPEYVVDKATKLETIYDRIHEVRMRFEVLKRDAEVTCLQAIVAGGDKKTARDRLAAELLALDDDFAFVATCNEGGEFMAPEKIDRLKSIATRTWTRTLDDRIGIAHEERTRKMRTPSPALPVRESLLADKPEHRIERRPADRFPEGNKWGFRMTVPELLYNRGELHNLCVARGTLSDEERYKINEHIIQTEIMLTQLPFPKHLRKVPEIACGHHEKMDGTGYPKQLTKDQMSPVARMIAIADIFEALTAADRPYKKGKTLSESIKIMSFMKKDQHIDPELFDLFLRSGIYQEYAERYMRPEQIDEVNTGQYLSAPVTN